MPNLIKCLTVGWLIFIALGTTRAEEEQPPVPQNSLSSTAREVESHNIATPEHNLYILTGKEPDINPAQRLGELSVKEFVGTSPFFALRSLLKHNQLNEMYRVGKCVNKFRVNDEENWQIDVTFEANAATEKWLVKKVSQTKKGKITDPLQANDPLYQQSLNASSGCVFTEFPNVWLALKGTGASNWFNDAIEKLTPLDGKRAVFDNLVFYQLDHANPKHKILTAVGSIQLEYAKPDPKNNQFQNGWLISDFEFLDDEGKEYDLEKAEDPANAIIPSTPMSVLRNKPFKPAATVKPATHAP